MENFRIENLRIENLRIENLRIEKVLKRKGDKLYIKWKGYDNRFNSWINKKDLT